MKQFILIYCIITSPLFGQGTEVRLRPIINTINNESPSQIDFYLADDALDVSAVLSKTEWDNLDLSVPMGGFLALYNARSLKDYQAILINPNARTKKNDDYFINATKGRSTVKTKVIFVLTTILHGQEVAFIKYSVENETIGPAYGCYSFIKNESGKWLHAYGADLKFTTIALGYIKSEVLMKLVKKESAGNLLQEKLNKKVTINNGIDFLALTNFIGHITANKINNSLEFNYFCQELGWK